MNTKKITIITAEFNQELTDQMTKDAIETFVKNGINTSQIETHRVPGALELPLAAKWAIEEGTDAVICFGVVIRGETTHYDEVCRGSTSTIQHLMLSTGIPVLTGILTTENKAQAENRVFGPKGKKGIYCAESVIKMLQLKNKISKK